MAESGVAASAARRGTPKAVAGRLQRVQEALGRGIGRAGTPERQAQLLRRFGTARTAAENTINARNK